VIILALGLQRRPPQIRLGVSILAVIEVVLRRRIRMRRRIRIRIRMRIGPPLT
jgi:hypothetical protein